MSITKYFPNVYSINKLYQSNDSNTARAKNIPTYLVGTNEPITISTESTKYRDAGPDTLLDDDQPINSCDILLKHKQTKIVCIKICFVVKASKNVKFPFKVSLFSMTDISRFDFI